jgi:hypothetical protein
MQEGKVMAQLYQGPVRPTDNEDKFRKTGITEAVKEDKKTKKTRAKSDLLKRITSKEIFKKSKQATYNVAPPADYSRSSFFNNQYEKEKNLLTWK